MPPQVTWIERVPEILSVLKASPLPVLDRSSVQQLFRLQARQALRLMQSIGGYQGGNACLVRREDLIAHLKGKRVRQLHSAVQRERLARVIQESLDERPAREERPPNCFTLFKPVPKPEACHDELPDGVRLSLSGDTSELRVFFQGHYDLQEKILKLAQYLDRNPRILEEEQRERERAEVALYRDWKPGVE
jgi:hypothetical protein